MSGRRQTHCESVCLLIRLDFHVIGGLLHSELLQRLRLQPLLGQNSAMTTTCAKHILMLPCDAVECTLTFSSISYSTPKMGLAEYTLCKELISLRAS